MILRVSPLLTAGTSPLHALTLDLRKKQVTVLESATQSTQRLAASATSTPKTFTFDAAFGPESSQVQITQFGFVVFCCFFFFCLMTLKQFFVPSMCHLGPNPNKISTVFSA